MGNSLSYVRPWPNVMIAGKMENGCEAFDYLRPVQEFSIEEHTPSGVTFIKHPPQAWGCNDNIKTSSLAKDSQNTSCVDRPNAPKHSATKPCSHRTSNPDFSDGWKLRYEENKDLFEDVVYSILSILEEDRILLPASNSQSKIPHSVSLSAAKDSLKEDVSTLRRSKRMSCQLRSSSILSSAMGSDRPSRNCVNSVSGEQLMAMLQNIFDVKESHIMEAATAAGKKAGPTKKFYVEILEAKTLRAKTQRDTSNPYCIVRSGKPTFPLSPEANSEVFKTVVAQECLEPYWNAHFTIDDAEILGGILCFEVWHSPSEKDLVEKITPKGFRKEARNLIGYATVDLQDFPSSGFDDWLKLTKIKTDDMWPSEGPSNKKRGELRVRIRTEMDDFQSYRKKQNFRALLSAIAHSHAHQHQDGRQDQMPWDGELTPSENAFLQIFCATFNISEEASARSWWLVLSPENLKVDQKYLFRLATLVKNCLKIAMFGKDKDNEELTDSIINWMTLQITKVKDLQTFYPSWCERLSKEQLSFSLRTVKFLEENMHPYLLNKTVHPFNLCLAEALRDFIKSWWIITRTHYQRQVFSSTSHDTNPDISPRNWKEGTDFLLCEESTPTPDITLSQLRATNFSLYRTFHGTNFGYSNLNKRKRKYSFDGETCETRRLCEPFSRGHVNELFSKSRSIVSEGHEQKLNHLKNLEVAVQCLVDVYKLLKDISYIYNAIFYEEFRIPFFRDSFLYLSNELASLIEPLLHELYSHHVPLPNLDPKADPLALENGTPTYQIHKNIRQIERLCIEHKFSSEIHLHSGLKDYWKWLSKGVDLWLQRTFLRAKQDIMKEIQIETLDYNDELYSSSAVSTIEIHKMVLNSWQHLHCPEDSKSKWFLKIGEGLSSVSLLYGRKLVRSKFTPLLQNCEGNDMNGGIKKQVCIIINNLILVSDALQKLPQLLQKTCPNFPSSRDEYERIFLCIEESSSELESLAKNVMEKTVNKVKSSCVVALLESCKLNNVSPLTEHLEQEVYCRKGRFLGKIFTWFLTYFWRGGILESFEEIMKQNKNKQKHTFFMCLSDCLKTCLTFLSHEDENIPFKQQEEYMNIATQLNHLKLSNEALITHFYYERYKEQEDVNSVAECLGEIALRSFISRNGVLTVNVILAKKLKYTNQSGIKNFFSSQDGSTARRVLPSTYVIVKLVPAQKFAGISSFKSKVQKKSVNPVYDVTFEFSLGSVMGNQKIEVGFLSVAVYSRECCSGDRFIGEGFLPLKKVHQLFTKAPSTGLKLSAESAIRPQNSSSEVPNVFLYLTSPKAVEDYISLRTLQMRTWDKSTSRFFKDIRKH